MDISTTLMFNLATSESSTPRHHPELPHHARPALPESFRMMALAVDLAQAREVHFGFDDGVYEDVSIALVSVWQEACTDILHVHLLAHLVGISENWVFWGEVVVGGPGVVV